MSLYAMSRRRQQQLSSQQSAQSYNPYQGGYTNANSEAYINSLIDKRMGRYESQNRASHAVYNPKSGWIHLQPRSEEPFDWANYPKVVNMKEYYRLKELEKSGQKSHDQAVNNYYNPEFQDEALRFHEAYAQKGAAILTSTEFPAITVSTVNQTLLNRQNLITQKYNLQNVPLKMTTDLLDPVFPEYNDTSSAVRVGYREGDAIDTTGYGAFTQTQVTMKKDGAGLGFTEEYYMKKFTIDVQQFMLDKISNDFTKARYSRVLTKLAAFTTQAASAGGWGAYTAGNLQSTNRPALDLNSIRIAINSDKLANADTVISRTQEYTDYIMNTWTRGIYSQDTSQSTPLNNIITNPAGVPWAKQWVINEDIPADTVYVLDHNMMIDLEGPRKTSQVQFYNPDQTVFFQKEWFDILVPSLRTAWGNAVTGA